MTAGLGDINRNISYNFNGNRKGLGTLASMTNQMTSDNNNQIIRDLEQYKANKEFAESTLPIEDSSDILLDLVPAGFFTGLGAKLFGKKALNSAEQAFAEKTLNNQISNKASKEVVEGSAKSKYPEELMKYHSEAASKLGYNNAEEMYDDFYKKFDVVDTYTDKAYSRLNDVNDIRREDIVRESMNSVLDDIASGKVKNKGYSDRYNMVAERRSIPFKDRKRGINSKDDYIDDDFDYDEYYDDLKDIDDYDKYYGIDDSRNLNYNEEKNYKNLSDSDKAIIDNARERMLLELGSKIKIN